jgi:hypothetical protein
MRAFERLLAPYFEMKARKDYFSIASKSAYVPSQADFFVIAKQWARLSDSFKAQYTRSMQIPDFMKYYVSPGGHFEIYYAIAGMDSANSDTVSAIDTFGFNSSNWRVRTAGSNGIPDYIDELAWAFDSAWSMEIDNFGFLKPLPYVSTRQTSERFKVITLDMDRHYATSGSKYYGQTNPIPGSSSAEAVGIQSYIELRNQWADWDDSIYRNHPERGIRVTAVHEFFHAIQYAMTRQASGFNTEYLDDFPLCWLEGSASLMENIGFDSVDDYIQYSGSFFENPTSTILNNDYGYTMVLLTMFLYERLDRQPSIEFIKRMFFNNYRAYIDFFANLESTAKTFNTTWPEIYGNFFTQSYYTGTRSRSDRFVHDAPLLPQWSAAIDSIDQGYSIKKNVPASGMKTFLPPQKIFPLDNGRLLFLGDSASVGSAALLWNVHCILHAHGDTSHTMDSIFSLPVLASGTSIAAMADWSRFDSAIIIVSNAGREKSHSASLVFEPCPVALHAGDSATYYGAHSAALSEHSSVSVTVKTRAEAACSVSLRSASASGVQLAAASRKGLVPINVFYSIGFPASWMAVSEMKLEIAEEALSIKPFENKDGITSEAFAIFMWDNDNGRWTKAGAGGIQSLGDIYRWQSPIAVPGLYGILGQGTAPDSGRDYKIIAFPNPVRRYSEIRFCANGKALMQLIMYSMNGSLVYRQETASPVDTMKWSLVNTTSFKNDSLSPYSLPAFSRSSMMIFFILSITGMVFLGFLPISSPIAAGMICQETPYLSLIHPHCSASGTAERFFQK